VAPTRELAVQIDDECRLFIRGMGISSTVCIGGKSLHTQIGALRRRPQFVIGTPGRLCDLEQQRALDFSQFTKIVFDEVDHMFDMGFIKDVEYITSRLPEPRQSLYFSATLPDSLRRTMEPFLKNPEMVSVKTRESAANVDQDIVYVNGRPKVELLHEMLVKIEFEKVLIFSRTKRGTEKLARTLHQKGLSVNAIHGNKTQNQRQRAIDEFKRNQIQVLVATDVASRGLDIDNVSHVINFDLPETYEDYIHRIGRTGRASKKGIALTFID
jgi:superfamily II DNA/RNA helicase